MTEKKKETPKAKCVSCGTTFEQKRFWQKFCCKAHQMDWNVKARAQEVDELKEKVRILEMALQKAVEGK